MRILFAITLAIACAAPAAAQRNLGEPFVFENEAGRTMPYRLFTPPAAEAGGDFPLVVFLHGSGERGTDNRLQVASHITGLINATQSEEFGAFLLAPQVPTVGNGWSADGVSDLGIEIIDALSQSLPIDSNRIYVTGLSMGGFGSFNYVWQHPDKFAAAVPMSGGFDPGVADVIKDTPVWSFHGDRDNTVAPEGSREMFQAITDNGGTTYLTEIVAGTHVIWSPIYGDASEDKYGLYDWMFSQTLERRLPSPIFDFGSDWAYVDDGSDQGELWRNQDYDDSEWKRGAAPLGFGYDDEATVLACGPAANCEEEQYSTFYFRNNFTVDDPTQIENVMAQLVRDDGVVVYVNGEEVFRDVNVRSADSFDDVARANALDGGLTAFRIDDAIVQGENTIGVELRQFPRGEVDLRFDMRVTAQRVPEPSSLLLAFVGCLQVLRFGRSKYENIHCGSGGRRLRVNPVSS